MPYSTVAGADGEASSFVTRSVEQASVHSVVARRLIVISCSEGRAKIEINLTR